MALSEDYDIVSESNLHLEEKSDITEGEFPLEKLLKLSKTFKTGIENNLSTFKNEKMSMLNEMSSMNYTPILNNCEPNETINTSDNQTFNKQKGDFNVLFWKESCETLRNLEHELKNVQNSLDVQYNGKEFRTQHGKEKFCMYMSSIQNKISDLHQMLNINQIINEKSIYLKKMLEIENKCQLWMDKYDELHDKYLRLESKCVNIEKENCSYQMEISRVKMIEDENVRLHQTINKSIRVRKELESALESCHEVVNKHQTDLETARNKVKEAVEVVEKTCLEKERLATDLKKSNEEIERLENELKNLIQEAGKKVNLEVEKVKTMYKDKLRETNVEIEFLRTEKQIACNKTQQISREYEILSKKYTSINKKCMNEPDIHSKRVALLVQQINEYEVAFNNLSADVEILKETNKKLQESYARKKTKYTMEISFLKDTTKSLENHLNKAICEIAEDNENIVKAKDRIKALEMEISKLKRPEDNLAEKNIQIEELIKHVEAHKQMLDMWRLEMHNIIDGFKLKINQLKQHCSKLYKNNVKLKRIVSKNSKNNCLTSKRKIMSRKKIISNVSSMSTST